MPTDIPNGPLVRADVSTNSPCAGVAVATILDDSHGCRGLHQRRLALVPGATLTAVAGGRGEAWYVTAGTGTLDAGTAGTVPLAAGTAVWLNRAVPYRCRAEQALSVLAVTVRAASPGDEDRPTLATATLAGAEVERTGDREFRVLLSAGLAVTQFAGWIPPGRAPIHQHTYDEVVHVLAGSGVVHLTGREDAPIAPGTSIYLPPGQPHCLENAGQAPLQILGVFHPAGSPAANHRSP